MTSQASAPNPVEEETAGNPSDWPEEFDADPRWLLALSVVRSRHFARAPLLSRFLLHIIAETLQGRDDQITEHQIGVRVFGRPESYRTVEDNIVRNYARQLRRRLADHFAAVSDERMRIEVPVGGYVPFFIPLDTPEPVIGITPAEQPSSPEEIASAAPIHSARASIVLDRSRMGIAKRLLLITGYSVLLIALTYLFLRASGKHRSGHEGNLLWQTLLNGPRATLIVPPDAGFNLVEDLTRHPIPLADYIRGGYTQSPLPQFDEHTAKDLRMHEFTDFVDMQIVASLMQVPEYNPQRLSLRFPRDLRLDDLKDSNAIIVGSVCSNPWASLADARTTFHIVCSQGMQSSSIVNTSPLPGEQQTYVSRWDEPTHTTYALIRLVPNLSGDGHLLLLEGLDVAGTQAAAETLLHSAALKTIVQRARQPDGTLGSFEVLLRATSIESNAAGAEIVASRIH